jgi:acyl-CoA thioesterase
MARSNPLDTVRALMRRDRFAARCGIRLVELREGFARARLRLTADHLNGVGVVQGGAIFTLADLAFAAASNSRGAVAVALDATITFARGAVRGTLTAEAREIAVSRRVSLCEVRVTDTSGALVAAFQGTAFRKDETTAAIAAAPRTPRRTRGRAARGGARRAHSYAEA